MTATLSEHETHRQCERLQQLQNDVFVTIGMVFVEEETVTRLSARLKDVCHRFEKPKESAKSRRSDVRIDQNRPISGANGQEQLLLCEKSGSLFGDAKAVTQAIIGAGAAISAPSNTINAVADMVLEAELFVRWSRDVEQFLKRSNDDGWRLVKDPRLLAGHNLPETARPGGSVSELKYLSQAISSTSQCREAIAKFLLASQIPLSLTQITHEYERVLKLSLAIEIIFYTRFSVNEWYLRLKTTAALYRNLEVFLNDWMSLAGAEADRETQAVSLRNLMQSILHIHADDLDRITDDAIWSACDAYDSPNRHSVQLYTANDPPKSHVRHWLEDQVTKAPGPFDSQGQDQYARRVNTALAQVLDEASKAGLRIGF